MKNNVIKIGREIIDSLEHNNKVKAYDILNSYVLESDEADLLYYAINKWCDFIEGKITYSDVNFVTEKYTTGYISRKGGSIEKLYIGRYGIGFAVHKPAYNTSRYHRIAYYIFK